LLNGPIMYFVEPQCVIGIKSDDFELGF